MERYIIFCTKEQTERAIKLGAPCENPDDFTPMRFPTAEQMRGWLREEYGIQAFVSTLVGNTASVYVKGNFTMFNVNNCDGMPKNFDTYEQAILAAIDAALDYLEKGE